MAALALSLWLPSLVMSWATHQTADAPMLQEETISTLDYAHRAKNIRNKPELNQKISKTTMIKELAAEIERLRVDLSCSREKSGVYIPLDRYEQVGGGGG